MEELFLMLISMIAVSKGFAIPGGKIYGGEAAAAGEIPYQVSVFEGQEFICGGAILGREWIVTAAHCLDKERRGKVAYLVRAGSLELETGGSVHEAVAAIVNPGYGKDDNAVPFNDIALIKVDPPINFSKEVSSIPLPDQSTSTPVGKQVVVSGWGLTEAGFNSPVLLKVILTICGKQDCNRILMGLPENQICAWSQSSNKDACGGDSGGPLTLDGVLHGIVSWGEDCGIPGIPGAYTEVSAYRDWIKDVTGI